MISIKDILAVLARIAPLRRLRELEKRLEVVEAKLDGKHADVVCDACGSRDLKRIGNRPHRSSTLARQGKKQAVYRCRACDVESIENVP